MTEHSIGYHTLSYLHGNVTDSHVKGKAYITFNSLPSLLTANTYSIRSSSLIPGFSLCVQNKASFLGCSQ